MTDSDIKRINFCARVFRANGQELVVLADHRIRYQVGTASSPTIWMSWSRWPSPFFARIGHHKNQSEGLQKSLFINL